MDSPDKRAPWLNQAGPRDGLILLLMLAWLAPALFWQPWTATLSVGFNAISRPLMRVWQGEGSTSDGDPRVQAIPPSDALKLAFHARSMEFRLQQYAVQPEHIRAWSQEWRSTPAGQGVLLCQLLRKLPEATAQESSAEHRQGMIRSVLETAAAARKARPDNGFFWLAESLALFYSAQDQAAVSALDQALKCNQFHAGLRELNRSEYRNWQVQFHSRALLPPLPRLWGFGLEQPLHGFSRGLALQERALLRQYNLERAIELGLLHLAFARRFSEAARSPADHAMAEMIAQRALEPFWSRHGRKPTLREIQDNFLTFLEDQGDAYKLDHEKVSAWFASFEEEQQARQEGLTLHRRVQLLGSWSISSVLACLFLQSASLLLGWITITFLAPRTPAERAAPCAFLPVAMIAFWIAPLSWTLCGWTAGGAWLLLGLAGSWILWLFILRLTRGRLSLNHVQAALSGTLLMMLMTTFAVTVAAACAYHCRQEYLEMLYG